MKRILLFFLLSTTTFANNFSSVKDIFLQKDEEYKVIVKHAHFEKIFTLRWTLYVNEGLVVFHSYNKQVFQNILYLNTKNQSFKFYLKTKGADFYETPYLFVKFEKFDFKKHKAEFKIFLSDKKGQIRIKYPEKK